MEDQKVDYMKTATTNYLSLSRRSNVSRAGLPNASPQSCLICEYCFPFVIDT